MLDFIKKVLENMPSDWLKLTTHRLDIYEEEFAKTQFLEQFATLYKTNIAEKAALGALPTAYDYIRLGHPLSCVLEWVIAQLNDKKADNVISFSSKVTPLLAVLRTNLLANRKTRVVYTDALPATFDAAVVREVYGYHFEVEQVASIEDITASEGSTIFYSEQEGIFDPILPANGSSTGTIDVFVNGYTSLGSVLVVNSSEHESYISDIQHVRRRETIAMTPINTLAALTAIVGKTPIKADTSTLADDRRQVLDLIKKITDTSVTPQIGSSGLSVQYAIMMGLVDYAQDKYSDKEIKFIVPPNCYGGTNDQARRVVACLPNAEVVDLPVDGDNDMVSSLDRILAELAESDAVPYIIAEIPTNPRVEVPELDELQRVLGKERKTTSGQVATAPVFILDQTFCPNVHFLGEGQVLSGVKAISYASGSKFPSGGLCTAGYCAANNHAADLMEKIALHMRLCDNEATAHQTAILAQQLPSMNQRIADAYVNTRSFVNFIQEVLPTAKINFVSEELAQQGFTPSVFSLDLPTVGDTEQERERHKRALNLKLIQRMITKIPTESKFCVSYGQLKGCYWTIPATSTQGTTKEGDKDYIVRASLSPDMDLDLHKQVFLHFVGDM